MSVPSRWPLPDTTTPLLVQNPTATTVPHQRNMNGAEAAEIPIEHRGYATQRRASRERQVRASGSTEIGTPFASTQAYPLFVQHPENHRWVELRCMGCDPPANAYRHGEAGERTYFEGVGGLVRHLNNCHQKLFERWSQQTLVRPVSSKQPLAKMVVFDHCVFKPLSTEEVKAMENGVAGAYPGSLTLQSTCLIY